MSAGEKPAVKRIRAKGWFCTWPKCALSKEDVLGVLKLKYDVEEYVICCEKHADGENHLHAFLKVANRITFKADMFDIHDYHGHYEVAKSWKAVKEYVKKDGDYISNLNLENAMKSKSKKLFKEDLLKSVEQVLDEGKISGLQVAQFYKCATIYKMLAKKKPMPEEMPPKKRHLWFYGPSNSGKTSKLREMIKLKGEDNCFQMPTNNDWIGYYDQQMLYMDEFKGQLTIQELNRICDGGTKVNIKGASAILRWDVQVVICSNFSIKECYSKASDDLIETLLNRFKVEQLLKIK